MPKGRVLTPAEREEIARMHEAGASGREIAKKLARSKTVVLNFLKNPAQYAQIKRSGRKRALSSEDERRLYVALFQPRASSNSSPQGSLDHTMADLQNQGAVQEERLQAPAASSGADELGAAANERGEERSYPTGHQDIKKSAEQIKKEFNVPLSVRRVQQLLSDWRRDARRAQDMQHQVQQMPHASPMVGAVVDLGGDSGATGGAVIQENSNESGGISIASDSLEPTTVVQSFVEGDVGEADEAPAKLVEALTREEATPSTQEPPEVAKTVVDPAESAIAAPSYLGEAAGQEVDGASSDLQETSAAVAIENAEVVVDTPSDMSTIQV